MARLNAVRQMFGVAPLAALTTAVLACATTGPYVTRSELVSLVTHAVRQEFKSTAQVSVNVARTGKFNSVENYWPVKAHVAVAGQGELGNEFIFYWTADCKLWQDGQGDWKAAVIQLE